MDWSTKTAGLALKSLDGNHLEILFPCTALWTSPVHGHIGPWCAWRNAVIGCTQGFVINPATNQAHPSRMGHRKFPL